MVYEILAEKQGSKVEQIFECQQKAYELYKELTDSGYLVQWTCFDRFGTIEQYCAEKLKVIKEEYEKIYN